MLALSRCGLPVARTSLARVGLRMTFSVLSMFRMHLTSLGNLCVLVGSRLLWLQTPWLLVAKAPEYP